MITVLKVRKHSVEKDVDFMTDDTAVEVLWNIEKTYGWPISKCLLMIIKGKMDGLVFTRDDPYLRFSAHIIDKAHILIRLKERDEIKEFELPVHALSKLITRSERSQ